MSHAPAANTRATITRPAALNLQNICTSLVVMLVGGAVPITHPLCDTVCDIVLRPVNRPHVADTSDLVRPPIRANPEKWAAPVARARFSSKG